MIPRVHDLSSIETCKLEIQRLNETLERLCDECNIFWEDYGTWIVNDLDDVWDVWDVVDAELNNIDGLCGHAQEALEGAKENLVRKLKDCVTAVKLFKETPSFMHTIETLKKFGELPC